MTSLHRTRRTATTLGAAALLLLAACGDDDDTSSSATTTTAEPEEGIPAELADYCAVATELNAGDFPTVEQLERYQEVAPEGIQDAVAVAAPAFIDAVESGDPESAFADPAVGEAISEIQTFEVETCGPEVAGDDAASLPTGDVDPEFAAWCDASAALSDAPVPTEELLAAGEQAAPDEIADDVHFVADAFRDGIAAGDPGLGFVRESYEHIVVINTFDAEHCGVPQDPGDFQDPAITTPDPDAAQVAVSASEFAFAFDPPAAAGPTTFTLTNDGALSHVMVILQAAEGYTAEQAFGSEDADAVAAAYGSYVAVPGQQAVLTIDLEPGEYMVFCYLPTTDGAPHLALGMTQPFTVS